ncbi:MAG: hypothetical protein ACE366_24770 [Bradymonadia bacterium]
MRTTHIVSMGAAVALTVTACAASGSRAVIGGTLALVVIGVVWALQKRNTSDDREKNPREAQSKPAGSLVPPTSTNNGAFDPLKESERQLREARAADGQPDQENQGEDGNASSTDSETGKTAVVPSDDPQEKPGKVGDTDKDNPDQDNPDEGDAGLPDAEPRKPPPLMPCLSILPPKDPPIGPCLKIAPPDDEIDGRICLSAFDVCLSPMEPEVGPCLSEVPEPDIQPCLEPPPPPDDEGGASMPTEQHQRHAARAEILDKVLARADLPEDVKSRLRRR